MGKLIGLFILVPAVELALLIEIGRRVGLLPTLLLILSTGALGAILARLQGLSTLRTIQTELSQGRLPAAALLDGLLILVAAAFLLTPGILTDCFGFLLLVPAARRWIRGELWRRLEQAGRTGRVTYSFSGDSTFWRSEPINVTPREPANAGGNGDSSPAKTVPRIGPAERH